MIHWLTKTIVITLGIALDCINQQNLLIKNSKDCKELFCTLTIAGYQTSTITVGLIRGFYLQPSNIWYQKVQQDQPVWWSTLMWCNIWGDNEAARPGFKPRPLNTLQNSLPLPTELPGHRFSPIPLIHNINGVNPLHHWVWLYYINK